MLRAIIKNFKFFVTFILIAQSPVAAIRDKFPTTDTLYCIFYIAQNIIFNFKNHLKVQYDEFVKDFFKVQQIRFVPIFEYQ